jgi:hypothetical protein
MRVFVSTVVRGTPPEFGGELLSLDWKTKRVLKRVPIFPTDPAINDSNPRGGGRGGRGIVLYPNELFVASYHSLLGYDFDLNSTRRIDNFQFAGLHELKRVEDGIWASSTQLGCALKVDLTGKLLDSWWAHEDPLVLEKFNPPPLPVDKAEDNRLANLRNGSKVHLNNVEVHNGRVYVSLHTYGAVLRLFPTEIVAHVPAFKNCHNGLVTNDGELLLNDSHGHTVVVFDERSGQIKRRINLMEFPAVAKLVKRTKYKNVPWQVRFSNFIRRRKMVWPLYTRGMCLLDESRVLVGVAPAAVLELDFKKGTLLDMFQISEYLNECVHGLEAAPSLDFPHSIGA